MHLFVAPPSAQARIKAFLLYASLPIGGIAFCFLLGTYALLELPLSWPLLVLGFCAAFLIYQAERTLHTAPEDIYNHPERRVWLAQHRRYVWISSLSAAGVAMAMLPLLRPVTLVAGVVLASLSVLYMVPFGKHGHRLKGYGMLKPVLISTAWSVGGVVLPVVQAGVAVDGTVLALVGYRFLFVLPNAVLSDWPDRKGDDKAGLRTLATRFSLRQLQWIATAALILGIGGVGIALFFADVSWILGIDALGLGLMLWLVWRPVPPSRFLFSFMLDALVAWPGVTACVVFWSG
ncbi:MAG TPA: UbiA family prenyltransferase [Rhodothermales bacterium]|nr:UbiA family prenyltransferase [Rhodothermales bacterium]